MLKSDTVGAPPRGWRALPWVGLAVVALAVLAGLLGATPGMWGQAAIYVLFLASVFALRRDVLSAVVLVGAAIVEDWFQLLPVSHGLHFTSLMAAMVLLAIIFIAQRKERPWRAVRPLDLLFWGVFLLLGLLAVPRSLNLPLSHSYLLTQALAFYAYVFLAAGAFWLLGTVVVREESDVRRLCALLAALATILAIHAIIQEVTGILLFETPAWAKYLADPHVNYFRLPGGIERATTFFVAPDIAESFFSSVIFLPLGLLVTARGWQGRALYTIEIVLILLALLFTFGPVGWAAVGVGVIIFALLGLRGRARVIFLGGLAAAVLAGSVLLAREWHTLLKHATGKNELGLRTAIWHTALNIIRAHPLLGIGLGTGAPYQLREVPYNDPSLRHTYPNPQNSFLEFAAFAGIPVLIVFLLILGRGVARAVRNYQHADATLRPVMLGLFLVLVGFSINGLSDITFVAPPLVPLGYLVLGALASPRLTAALTRAKQAARAEPPPPTRIARPVRYGPPLPAEPSAY